MVFFICSVIVVQADRTCRHLPLFYEGNHLTPRIEKNITPITNAARKERRWLASSVKADTCLSWNGT